jgi:hypothetical protein
MTDRKWLVLRGEKNDESGKIVKNKGILIIFSFLSDLIYQKTSKYILRPIADNPQKCS